MIPYRPDVTPYCGAPPAPPELLSRWNLDPVLIALLAALLGAYALWAPRRPPAMSDQARRWFLGGWAVSALTLVSPLCPLSVALFSARAGQHMILILLAAPMVALGLPAPAARSPSQRGGSRDTSLFAALLFMALLWFWHAPRPYTATFESPAAYWAMHISLVSSATWLWAELLTGRASVGRAASAGLSMLQMGLLGALISLSGQAAYPPHRLTTAAWGLTPLADQQLGGLIMWVPGGLVFLLVASRTVLRLLEARPPARALRGRLPA